MPLAHTETQTLVNNENIEYRMTLSKDSADWNRWINNYLKGDVIFNRETQ